MAADCLLELQDLRKAFGGVVANDGVTLDVGRGDIVGLIGPNGSGKTTLFNCISGHERRDAGIVRFDGRRVDGLGEGEIARLGLMRTFQHAHVYSGMSPLDNLAVSGRTGNGRMVAMWAVVPLEVKHRALALLDAVGLGRKEDVPAGQLSYGERKLLELAMALMGEPKLLLLDEPTAGVDPRMIGHIVERLQWVNRVMGVTLLVIEHNMRVVMGLAHRIHCLAHGRLLATGTPEEIRADPRVVQAYLGAG